MKQTSSPNDLIPPFNLTFEDLRSHCDCEPLSLMMVLKKLDFITGPGLDSFEAEIAQDHLPAIAECHALPASALAVLRDELIALVYKASSLSIDDPARHWYGLNQDDNDNPTLRAKRIAPETVISFIHENWLYLFNLVKDSPILSGRLAETLNYNGPRNLDTERG